MPFYLYIFYLSHNTGEVGPMGAIFTSTSCPWQLPCVISCLPMPIKSIHRHRISWKVWNKLYIIYLSTQGFSSTSWKSAAIPRLLPSLLLGPWCHSITFGLIKYILWSPGLGRGLVELDLIEKVLESLPYIDADLPQWIVVIHSCIWLIFSA